MLIARPPLSVLARLSEFVVAKLGLNFPPEKWPDLERALEPAVTAGNFGTLERYADWLLSAHRTPAEIEALAARLTIGETYFFREPQAFEALRDHLVPEILASQRGAPPQLRVWSAGCCTGEEAYSLAIFFHRCCPELRGVRISILATDLNPHFLRKAREGIYRNWSFRGAPAWLQRDYFRPLGDERFELRPDIRQMVEFQPLNLAQHAFPSLHHQTHGLHLIFCRNVLMYFSPGQARRVIAGFHRSLADTGCLVVSVCEVSSTLAPEFRARSFAGVTIYQKSSRPVARGRSVVARPAAGWLPDLAAPAPAHASETQTPPTSPPSGAVLEARTLATAEDLFQRGEFARAAEHAETVLTAGPLDLPTVMLLARARANLGMLIEARKWIERALVIHKLHAPLHYLRAVVLLEQGEAGPAADALARTLYLEPDHALAHLALADLVGHDGRAEKARRHLTHALRLLRLRPGDEVMPEADGLTVGRLSTIVEAMLASANRP